MGLPIFQYRRFSMDNLLSKKALLEFLGVSDRQLRRLIAAKKLRPATKRGRQPLFRADDAMRLLPVSDYELWQVLALVRAVFRLKAGEAGMAQKHMAYQPQFGQCFSEWLSEKEQMNYETRELRECIPLTLC